MQFFIEYFDSYRSVDGSKSYVRFEIYAVEKIFKLIGFKRVDLYK